MRTNYEIHFPKRSVPRSQRSSEFTGLTLFHSLPSKVAIIRSGQAGSSDVYVTVSHVHLCLGQATFSKNVLAFSLHP